MFIEVSRVMFDNGIMIHICFSVYAQIKKVLMTPQELEKQLLN